MTGASFVLVAMSLGEAELAMEIAADEPNDAGVRLYDQLEHAIENGPLLSYDQLEQARASISAIAQGWPR